MAEHLPPHSILEALRPDPGWRTDKAILSTYSLDLYALVAALLALRGVVDDAGSAAAHELAATLEDLSDNVRILAQRGRITAPQGLPRGLGILDRFVDEQALDESRSSWHAKLAIVRYVHEELEESRWRCWIGSRNLTKASNWDLGLLLVGSTDWGSGAVEVDGIRDAWLKLTGRLRRPIPGAEPAGRELGSVRWSLGDGRGEEESAIFRLMLPDDPNRGYPAELAEEFDELWIVSPFLGESTIRAAGGWGGSDCSRILVSTGNDLRKIAAQAPHALEELGQIRMRDAATDVQIMDTEEEGYDRADDEDALEELTGLHAKLALGLRQDQAVLWLGSPNLTRRGWHDNAEAFARLEVGEDVIEGIKAFADAAQPTTVSALLEAPPEEETELEHARRDLSAITDVRQVRSGDGFLVLSAGLGKLSTRKLKVSVGRVTGTTLRSWPPGASQLSLPSGGGPAAETELLRVRLQLGSDSDECIIFAPLDPPPGEARDRAAIASLLRPSGLLRWLAGLLEAPGQLVLEGENWERQLGSDRHGGSSVRASLEGLTLESILRAWTKDPRRIEIARQKAERYLAAVLDSADEESSEDLEALKKFQETWRVVTSTLGGRHA